MRVPGDICALGFLNRNKKKVREIVKKRNVTSFSSASFSIQNITPPQHSLLILPDIWRRVDTPLVPCAATHGNITPAVRFQLEKRRMAFRFVGFTICSSTDAVSSAD